MVTTILSMLKQNNIVQSHTKLGLPVTNYVVQGLSACYQLLGAGSLCLLPATWCRVSLPVTNYVVQGLSACYQLQGAGSLCLLPTMWCRVSLPVTNFMVQGLSACYQLHGAGLPLSVMLTVTQIVMKFPDIMEPDGSLPCSQKLNTGPCPEAAQFVSHPIYPRHIFMSSSHPPPALSHTVSSSHPPNVFIRPPPLALTIPVTLGTPHFAVFSILLLLPFLYMLIWCG